MNQANIGKFIGTLRREKNLTQEQLAEILGVNNRSISRWENGHCMPDLSLLQDIAEELGVTIPELLNGRHMDGNQENGLRDSIELIVKLSNGEKRRKTKALNHYFAAGFICCAAAILQYQFGILSLILQEPAGNYAAEILVWAGILFEFAGFYHNNQDKAQMQENLEQLLKNRREVRMRTVQEMLQFAGRYQNVDLKQYKLAFKEIEKELTEHEPVIFAATGKTYALNEMPMMWHVAIAVTKSRMIIGGERMKGMLMTSYMTQSFPAGEIMSVGEADVAMGSVLVIKTRRDELKIEVESHEALREIIQELNSKL